MGEELLLLAGGAARERLRGALRGQVLEEGGVEGGGVGLGGGEAGAVLADPARSRALEGGGEGEALDESVPALGDELLGLRALQLAGDPLHRAELGEGLSGPLGDEEHLLEDGEGGEVLEGAADEVGGVRREVGGGEGGCAVGADGVLREEGVCGVLEADGGGVAVEVAVGGVVGLGGVGGGGGAGGERRSATGPSGRVFDERTRDCSSSVQKRLTERPRAVSVDSA